MALLELPLRAKGYLAVSREIRLHSDHIGILAVKRLLGSVAVVLVGYDIQADGGLTLHLEDRDYEKARGALIQAGFNLD